MSMLVAAPVMIPLAGAALGLALGRWVNLQRVLGFTALGATVAASVALLDRVRDGSILVFDVGGWQAPVGITLVADPFAAVMLTVSAVILLAVLVYAMGSPRTADLGFFHPLYLVMAAGVAASFLTSDLFNLFVAFEVTLTASYVLITLGGTRAQVRHGMTYVVISLLASTLFVTAVGLIYAATGTVNMADLAVKLDDIDPGLRSALGVLFLVVFGVKAAIFPLFFWLPDSYPTAPAPVTAIFAGLLTKVGVYAIIRTHTLLFGETGQPSALLLGVAGLTMVVGVLGAIAQNDVKRILSFHIISQIGYMIFGLGLFTAAGLAAAVFFTAHQIVVKTTLFLVGGLVEERTGTGALHRLGGLLHSTPFLAALFLLPALSLAGIPPLGGFVAKLTLVQAGLDAGANVTVAVSLFVSLLTLFSMLKIWGGVFWGKADEDPPIPEALEANRLRFPRLMVVSTAFLVAVGVGWAVGAAPLYDITVEAARVLIDPTTYVEAVLR